VTECKLCLQNKSLINAHIYPQCILKHIRKILPNQQQNKSHFLLAEKNNPQQKIVKNNGFFDKSILCEACDAELGKYEEKLKEFLINCDTINKLQQYVINGKYHYNSVKLAILGILWKSHITSLCEFEEVNLGLLADDLCDTIKQGIVAVLDFPLMVSQISVQYNGIDPNTLKYTFGLPVKCQTENGLDAYQLQILDYKFDIIIDKKPLPNGVELFIFNHSNPNITYDTLEEALS
jgi:hypothetical protein